MHSTRARSRTPSTPISSASAAICATRISPAHHGEWVTPLSVNYRGYDVYELPPNGQGVAVLQMLQILKGST